MHQRSSCTACTLLCEKRDRENLSTITEGNEGEIDRNGLGGWGFATNQRRGLKYCFSPVLWSCHPNGKIPIPWLLRQGMRVCVSAVSRWVAAVVDYLRRVSADRPHRRRVALMHDVVDAEAARACLSPRAYALYIHKCSARVNCKSNWNGQIYR